MVRLRNGTPEHGGGNHLLLSLLIPFDQNNCRLHRHHRFCRLGPSHRGLPLAGGHSGMTMGRWGAGGDGWGWGVGEEVGWLGRIRWNVSGLDGRKSASRFRSYHHHYIHQLIPSV